jgi:alpha-L-arabinofuranosidase
VPITLNNDVVAGQDSLYASSCIDAATNELIIKIVNASGNQQINTIKLLGVNKLAKEAKLSLLQSNNLDAVNSFKNPFNVSPIHSILPIKGKTFDFKVAPYSFSVVRIKIF